MPTATRVTKGKMKNQTLPPSFLKGCPKSSSTDERGVAPFSINSPVVSARCSAFAIGPKSLPIRSEEHTSELQSRFELVCRLLLEKKKIKVYFYPYLFIVCLIYLSFNDVHTVDIYSLSLHDALPI